MKPWIFAPFTGWGLIKTFYAVVFFIFEARRHSNCFPIKVFKRKKKKKTTKKNVGCNFWAFTFSSFNKDIVPTAKSITRFACLKNPVQNV